MIRQVSRHSWSCIQPCACGAEVAGRARPEHRRLRRTRPCGQKDASDEDRPASRREQRTGWPILAGRQLARAKTRRIRLSSQYGATAKTSASPQPPAICHRHPFACNSPAWPAPTQLGRYARWLLAQACLSPGLDLPGPNCSLIQPERNHDCPGWTAMRQQRRRHRMQRRLQAAQQRPNRFGERLGGPMGLQRRSARAQIPMRPLSQRGHTIPSGHISGIWVLCIPSFCRRRVRSTLFWGATGF